MLRILMKVGQEELHLRPTLAAAMHAYRLLQKDIVSVRTVSHKILKFSQLSLCKALSQSHPSGSISSSHRSKQIGFGISNIQCLSKDQNSGR